MTSPTASCYITACQSVKKAIVKDDKGETKEAYGDYLNSMLLMIQALKADADSKPDIHDISFEETFKLFKLTEQCLGRAHDIVSSNHGIRSSSPNNQQPSRDLRAPVSPVFPSHANLSPNDQRKVPANRRVSEPVYFPSGANRGNHYSLLNNLPSPPGTRKPSPQNQKNEMTKALERRKTISGVKTIKQKYANTSHNLALYRKAAERQALTLAKEKEMHGRWLEKQNEIKLEAEKRWNLKMNRSQKDKEYRQNLLEEILAFEDAVKWPAKYRDSLHSNPRDINVIIYIVQTVLRCRDHPLCKVCKGLQYLLYQKISETLKQSEDNENYLAPSDTSQKQRTPVKYKQTPGNTLDNKDGSGKNDASVSSEDSSSLSMNSDLKKKEIDALKGPSNNGESENKEEAPDENYRPIPVPRKRLSEFSKKKSLETNADRKKDVVLPSPPENDAELSSGDVGITIKKVDSLEKVYDELGDIMFTDDSDEENGNTLFLKDNITSVPNLYEISTSDNNTPPSNHDSSGFESLTTNDKTAEKVPEIQKTLEQDEIRENVDSDKRNPIYFVSNETRIQSSGSSSQDDIIPLSPNKKNVKKLYENLGVNFVKINNSNVIPTGDNISTDGADDVTKHDVKPDVLISVISPTLPRSEIDFVTHPFRDDEEHYSDVSDEFKEEVYESLVPSPTANEESNIDTAKHFEGANESEDEHTYFEVEEEKIGHGIPESVKANFSRSSGSIEEENYESLDTVEENIYEELDSLLLLPKKEEDDQKEESQWQLPVEEEDPAMVIDTFYLKRLDSIVQEIRFGIDRLHSVLLLAYEDLDATTTGRDQSYAALENILFQPLWPWLFQLFKKMNEHKEGFMRHIMDHYQGCTPDKMKIRDKFSLMDENSPADFEPYKEAVNEMARIRDCVSPSEKIECSVRVSKAIHTCIENYWCGVKGKDKAPTLGCDDLLPIITFVILKTDYAQLVSECHAMEEFIREDFLMGEEGYCLTTLHAAISYLVSLGKDLQVKSLHA